jgi:hypothetical protein
MRKFITRVRLKDAEQSDYEKLDKEMEKKLFSKIKLPKTGGKVNPARPREYYYPGGVSLREVTAAAYTAASKTGKEYSFTVMKEKPAIPV